MKTAIKHISFMMLMATLLWSCSKDTTNGSGEQTDGTGTLVRMVMSVGSTSATRASIAEEATINTVDMLVFKRSATAASNQDENATFLYSRHAWKSGSSYRATLEYGNDLDIYFAINVRDVLPTLTVGTTYADVHNLLIMADNPGELQKDNLPMWGYVFNVSIPETTEVVSLGVIELLRAVASTDIVIKDASFVATEAIIVNATDRGYLPHKQSNVDAGSGQIIQAVVPSDADYTMRWSNGFTTNTAGYESVENRFYFYESDASEISSTQPTKLIIKGKYAGSSEPTYYPLAFRKDNEAKVEVARNRKFIITVNSVNGNGYEDIEDAILADDVAIDYNVIEWDEYSNEINITSPDGTWYYVSFTNGRSVKIGDLVGSEAHMFFTSNAIEWDGEESSNMTMWFTDDESTATNTGSIFNDRFSVTLYQQEDGTYYFTVRAFAPYNNADAGDHTQTVTVNIADLLLFTVSITQVENAWVQGSDDEVIVSR